MTDAAPDAQSLVTRFRLVERGRDRGKRNEPPSDQLELDKVETEVVSDCEERLAARRHAYRQQRRLLEERIEFADDNAGDAGATDACLKMRNCVDSERPELESLARSAQQAVDEVERFKTDHKLDREAKLPDNPALSRGILVAMIVVETLVNGLFFGANMAGGLFGGTSYAVLVSLINVLVFGAIAAAALRSTRHRGQLRRLAGVLGLLLTMSAAVGWNLLVAHYREALASDYPPEPPAAAAASELAAGDPSRCWAASGEEAADGEAVCLLLSQWFALNGFQSYMLLLIGLAMWGAATWKCGALTDPYPGYGAKERARRRAEEDLLDKRSEILDQLKETFDESAAAQRELFVDPLELWKRSEQGVAQLREQHAGLRDFAEDLENACRMAIDVYRAENRAVRTVPAPEAWGRPWRSQGWDRLPEPPEAPDVRA